MANKNFSNRSRGKAHAYFWVRFFKWWWRELNAIVPYALRPKRRPDQGLIWLCRTGGVASESCFDLIRRDSAKWIKEAEINLSNNPAEIRQIMVDIFNRIGSRPVGICLPGESVLRKKISLPGVVRENIEQVIGYEIERYTPFNSAQVYYDFTVLKEGGEKNTLDVQLVVTPRKSVEKLFGFLVESGFQPRAMMLKDEIEGRGHCLDLLPKDLKERVSPWRKIIYGAMFLLTLSLLCLALLIPVWKKREQLLAIYPLIERVAPKADEVNKKRAELEMLAAQYNAPLEKKLRSPSVVEVVEELSGLLPDDTWVAHFSIKNDIVELSGESSSSAKLIGILEKSKYLENAQFKSPLVKERGGVEHFVLQANIGGKQSTNPLPDKSSANDASPRVSTGSGQGSGKADMTKGTL